MADVLTEICEVKRAHVDACMEEVSLSEMEGRARAVGPTRGFIKALRHTVDSGGYGLIAELKKASPSKGLIREDFDPATLAAAYERGGASCLSVLTDTPYFQGQDAYLAEARNAVALPVLRKDFMIDPYQVIESRALGADCILLIMAALSDAQAYELEAAAVEQGLDVLIEVHDQAELDRALQLESVLIGVNNRNLKDLSVDIARSEEMLAHFPDDRLAVSESGIYSPDDLKRMSDAGAHCFLVGESLMRHDDVEAATRSLLAVA
ncbi:MAG: indole-3-glycerol phosphate synthase TrpC [Rhodospirillales bacterium]|jgi:indole-3-glycerol phosphate synthase|nr:indole-3-glycerol phosphate synthase TrpC [Rhodospirillales bacterium]MBT4038803.1 indole-3-glycerol phosphate synthase TrpC [Rhodospirillales bacterium]MBT4625094.1 indole-3-glycerol phosphate synthase TrpC [Rhodospirillales bacterium]MBT5352971.1 indole-3-glycerol phosphate synthase TrpC [Rhodospirillales bacterium]MBT5519726.1 indole-3-glycerol phosphate synthase TrpC [Rhodospirillales bacterium]